MVLTLEISKKTYEDIMATIDYIVENIVTDICIQETILNNNTLESRRDIIHSYITEKQAKYNINFLDWVQIYQEPVFLKLQDKTKIDFGYCKFYFANSKNKIKSHLEHDLRYDTLPKCFKKRDKIDSLCHGIRKDCIIYMNKDGELR